MPSELAIARPSAASEQNQASRASLLEPRSLAELQSLGDLMAKSGFFADARQASQACVKILAGREMGFPPIASMVGISIIEGKPAVGANLIAAAMKRDGYTWKVLQRDAKGCRLVVSYRGTEIGPSEFLEQDAKQAGLLNKNNWTKFPRSMYFARTITDAARTYAPEVLAGLPAYTAEELGSEDTTEDGAAIINHVEPQVQPEQTIVSEQPKATEPVQPKRPSLDDQVPPALQAIWARMKDKISVGEELGALLEQLEEKIGQEKAREEFTHLLKRKGVASWPDLGSVNTAKQFAAEVFLLLGRSEPPKPFAVSDNDIPANIGTPEHERQGVAK